MKSRLNGMAVVFSLGVLAIAPALAQDDPVERTSKEIRDVHEWIAQCCPGKARTALAAAQSSFDRLGEFEKEKVANDLGDARKRVEDTLSGWTASQVESALGSSLHTVEERIREFSQDDIDASFRDAVSRLENQLADDVNKPLITKEQSAKTARRLEWLQGERAKAVAAAAIEEWKRTEDDSRLRGWENESVGSVDEFLARGGLGCPRCEGFARAVQAWLESPLCQLARARKSDDATLGKLVNDLTTKREQALAKVTESTKNVLAEAEKLPPGQKREQVHGSMGQLLHRYAPHEASDPKTAAPRRGRPDPRAKPKPPEPFPAGPELLARIQRLCARWDEELAGEKAERAKRLEKSKALADDAWPGMVAKLKPGKLESSEALANIGAFKGKVIRMTGRDVSGWSYEGSYEVIVEVDGVPVCGDLDDKMPRSFKHTVDVGGFREGVAVVEGSCKVWQRVKDPRTDRMVRGRQIDGVRVRIVALKCELFAGAVGFKSVGEGTPGAARSDDATPSGGDSSNSEPKAPSRSGGPKAKGPGAPKAKSPETDYEDPAGKAGATREASSETGGAVRFFHRLVAWGASLVLAFGATLALRPSRLGQHRPHAGVGLALLGTLWSGAAILSPVLVSECRLGSLPAAGLLSLGIYLAVDRAPPKALALGCMALSLVHFAFWDKPLL